MATVVGVVVAMAELLMEAVAVDTEAGVVAGVVEVGAGPRTIGECCAPWIEPAGPGSLLERSGCFFGVV